MVESETSSAPAGDAAHGAATESVRRVRVLLPLPLAGAFDYKVPVALTLAPGDVVLVPLGGRTAVGVVWDEARAPADALPAARLKDAQTRLDVPPFPRELRRFVDWVAAYTMSPPGAVLRMAMSVPAALETPKPQRLCALAAASPDPHDAAATEPRMTPARRHVLRELSAGPPRRAADLARAAGVGTGVVHGLIELGWVEIVAARAAPPPTAPLGTHPGPELSADQRAAAEALSGRIGGGFSVTLLDGVTGAGKTEVYFEAVAAALRGGRQALVLLPEIALSAQWLERFSTRFGAAPAAWHSELTPTQRRTTWRDVAAGRVRVVVGARSALFLPFPELGLIVIDEEHDGAFKQEEGVVYHARDMAVVRARSAEISAVLVSATPSLETVTNVERGRYHVLRLPDRHGGATLPHIAAIDLRRHPPPPRSFLSPILRQALTATATAGEQAMLFLNRRGYAPLTLCRACGHRLQCPNCTTWLVEHRLAGRLQCHHCGYGAPRPRECPACGAGDSLVACGPGVERLAEEVTALLPTSRIEVMTSDTITGPQAIAEFVKRMTEHEIDVLIGTQIVAKGHHFPALTLVGVVDADLGLSGGDLRAAERTYQLLHQVAGRAGRAAQPGRVLLQTYAPEHPVMQALAAGARDSFLAAEAAERRRYGWPPFGRLAALIVSGRDERRVDEVARRLGATAPHGDGIDVLGPAPAPLAVLRGRHRRRLLVKARREVNLQDALRHWLGAVKVPGTVRVQVDIDPYSFL